MQSPIIFDAPLDLSMNALEWKRDLRWTVPQIRDSERGMTDKPDRGRGSVIGVALDAWMLVPNWERGTSTPEGMGVSLIQAIDNIDHICQLAGNARHAGIGSYLDGAFGTEQGPADLDTIADLQKSPAMLAQRGYATDDIANNCSGNFVRFVRDAWR